MSDLVPYEIFNNYKKGVLDKETTVKYLKSYAEDGKSENLRVEAVDLLGKICLESDTSFKFLENLLISDSNGDVRSLVAKIIIFNCLKKGIEAIRWTFLNEKKVDFLIMIYKALDKLNTEESILLKAEMEAELASKYTKKYDLIPKEAIGLKFAELSIGTEIVDNYNCNEKLHGYAVFEAKNRHVVSLEIVQHNIESTRFLNLLSNLQCLKLSISNLKHIENLSNLTSLRYLDLTANFLTEIPGLYKLRNLEVLKIAWNNISKMNDFEKLKNLIKIDLSHNLIENKILRNSNYF
ncbi:MAG: hypothetical protein ACFFD5_09830 [Candidatus Thorarchaeota archaeon]